MGLAGRGGGGDLPSQQRRRSSSSRSCRFVTRSSSQFGMSSLFLERRGFHFWMRGGGGGSAEEESMATTDISSKRPYVNKLLDEYPLSVCSVQGWRDYMEDEFVTASDFAAVFDGHGGKAVSRYLRQNLYANLQAALPMVLESRPSFPPEEHVDGGGNDDDNALLLSSLSSSNSSHHDDDEAIVTPGDLRTQIPPFDPTTVVPTTTSTTTTTNTTSRRSAMTPDTTTTTASTTTPTVDDYEAALELALDKVDREVQRISHWSFQGSTAIAIWIHTAEDETTSNTSKESLAQDEQSEEQDVNASSQEQPSSDHSKQQQQDEQLMKKQVHRTLITANIGDSRAVLSRNGTAIELSRDHKPNDPIEMQRIHALGGQVVWHGQCGTDGEPIPGTGIYRVNGNLALSRAIGDRSERPAVTANPEFSALPITSDDEFVVLATDGLWDVMSSSDTVAYIHALVEGAATDDDTASQDAIAGMLVEEALRRGSYDNITIIVLWLKKCGPKKPKKWWI